MYRLNTAPSWVTGYNQGGHSLHPEDLLSFSISHILENICIANDILENMNTTQDALSGAG